MMDRKNAWLKYDEKQIKEIFAFCEGYKDFISTCKTERECVTEIIRIAKEHGYKDLKEIVKNGTSLAAGDKIYVDNMGKNVALFLLGEQPLEEGMKILGAHIDSPRIDLKQNPLYEDSEMGLFKTHYYGGIKKYQWVTLPLAIHGVVCKKDGTSVNVVIGEDETDPVVGITDLLVHLAQDQLSKTAAKVIKGEDLNILIASMPLKDTERHAVKANVLRLLNEKYGMEEEDFLSAELEVVPAGRARDYGIDRSMVMGYGQDDRVCAYASLMALLELEKTDRTCCCILVDKEEIGSAGATGMSSRFFENTVAELFEASSGVSFLKVRRCLQNSHMLSSDVSAAFDPTFPSTMEKKNSAYFGMGLVFNKYTGVRGKVGSNDANPEYMAKIRNIMDQHEISFQTAELGKVDQGGGGTIAYILAEFNMQVIDSGVAVLNMHSPWEITSKVDIYESLRGYKAFLLEV